MLFAEVVRASADVAATTSRTAKRDALAAVLAQMAPDEVEPGVGMLMGALRQGRVGVGWATIQAVAVSPAEAPSLTILDVDRAVDVLARTSGPGSGRARGELLADLFGRATADEADFLRRLLLGELRQGALEGVLTDAVARAAQVPATAVRRAAMLRGDLRQAAAIALSEGRPGLDRVGLSLLHPVQPMLASTADDIESALTLGRDGPTAPVSVEWKLDGARIQVHRDGDDVRVYSRNLNELTERLPEVVDLVRGLPAHQLVLDAEVLSVHPDERPVLFQDTMSRFGRSAAESIAASGWVLRPFFFDVLHVDGEDLLDEPLHRRHAALDDVAAAHRIPGVTTADPAEAAAFLDQAIAAGHEGVMVKDVDSPYQAGRRGKTWRKVKPVHLFDLVVLAAEWGHGRRQGWLSNLHLGARDPRDGSFVMVGKTFKGLTDELLTWQTAELLAREVARDGIVVDVRPELVVEVAIDGVQSSTRYPGGVALRFARVRRYRIDKRADDVDSIESLRALLAR